MSTTEIPEDVEFHSPIAGLAAITADLLAMADHVGLMPPRYVAVSTTRHIGLQLPPDRASIDAVRVWAETFCAAMRSDTHVCEHGPVLWVSTAFNFDDADIDVYAHIPVSETEPITSTEQDDQPETALPF